ncbi:hypothetical protein PCC7424_1052 [Gloeothece citriformis PCC 7424]|uniref:Uncharacterized protein n=1 Tax=Gloeothece citriformis (strain PCC 7424) TaxID=65393 RepID=B7KJQ7_GLOC7|nr:hypothetical protein [Gloeothece citriformis]ACK69506.1 hypothetical protein PCC7424_1052 [Gloeothece citriformis PCC 7424]
MPLLKLTVEQVIDLVKQLPPRDKKAVLDALQNENTETEHPWMKFAEKYKDDPQFDKMMAYIEADRRELDAEIEQYYQTLEENPYLISSLHIR